MEGVDQTLPFVLICCTDPKDFCPRGSVLRNRQLIMALLELGAVLVNVNHMDVGLQRK